MIDKKNLYDWCRIKACDLASHPMLKAPFRLVNSSTEMGELMARELVDGIKKANEEQKPFRAIIPCGPKCWYEPYVRIVNAERVSLKNFTVFHMDECLDWEGNALAENDPHNFRAVMEKCFYGGINPGLEVPMDQRFFPSVKNIDGLRKKINEAQIDLTMGGWGQDGHVAYNQARRHQYSKITLEDLRNSSIRVQENNPDTIMALAQRTFGAAYQFVPPMSVTLGIKECFSAKKIRLYSDTGAWKQTALRVCLFSEPDAEYPMTLLQEHPDALITATYETASHPISENPEWEFKGVNA